MSKKAIGKHELINEVAQRANITKKAARDVVEATFGAVTDFLAKGENVQLVGFGSFKVRERAERKGRNPQTKEEITIPASKVPAFKAGKSLKDAVK